MPVRENCCVAPHGYPRSILHTISVSAFCSPSTLSRSETYFVIPLVLA